jgi:hypothetical protein
VAAVEAHRLRARRAVFVRIAVVAAVVAVGLVAFIGVPFAAVVGAAECCKAFFEPRPWLLVGLFLGTGLLVAAAGIAAGVYAYRAVGSYTPRYQRRFREAVAGPLLSSALPGSKVDIARGLSREELEGTGFFPAQLTYDATFRVDGRTGDVAWATGDVKAWRRVASSAGSDSATTLLTWLHGFLATVDVACPVPTPVLVVPGSYFHTGVGMARRADLVRGDAAGDPAFDAVFTVCAADTETVVPPLSPAMRRALLALRERFGEHAFFSLTPSGAAIAVPVYGRIAQDSRRLLEPRLLAANEAGELQREAALAGMVPDAAAALARAARDA